MLEPRNSEEVNMNYWYDEKDNLIILLALIKHKNLKTSRPAIGLVLEQDGKLYTSNGYSYTLGLDYVIGNNAEENTSKLDFLSKELERLLAWNVAQLSAGKVDLLVLRHKFLLPMNINKAHWVALEIEIEVQHHNTQFYLSPIVQTKVYDSSPQFGIRNSEVIHAPLEQYFDKFTNNSQPIEFQNSFIIATIKQIDHNSCGPITCANIISLLEGKEIKSSSFSYTVEEIRGIRAEHLLVVDQENFNIKQKTNLSPKLGKKIVNGDTLEQAKAIYKFIADNLPDQKAAVFVQLQEYINIDNTLQNSHTRTVELSVKHFEKLDEEYKQKLSEVKKWFKNHYEPLQALELLNNIFKKLEKIDANSELEWVDGGKDTLVEVLKNLLKIPNLLLRQQQLEEQQKQIIEEHQALTDVYLRYAISSSQTYIYNGMINADKMPHSTTLMKSSIFEAISDEYRYRGEYANGVQVGFGDEGCFYADLRFVTKFRGERDKQGKLQNGDISCFLGEKLDDDNYLVCKGELYNGLFDGRAEVFLLSNTEMILLSRLFIVNGSIYDSQISQALPEALADTYNDEYISKLITERLSNTTENRLYILLPNLSERLLELRSTSIERYLKNKSLEAARIENRSQFHRNNYI